MKHAYYVGTFVAFVFGPTFERCDCDSRRNSKSNCETSDVIRPQSSGDWCAVCGDRTASGQCGVRTELEFVSTL